MYSNKGNLEFRVLLPKLVGYLQHIVNAKKLYFFFTFIDTFTNITYVTLCIKQLAIICNNVSPVVKVHTRVPPVRLLGPASVCLTEPSWCWLNCTEELLASLSLLVASVSSTLRLNISLLTIDYRNTITYDICSTSYDL